MKNKILLIIFMFLLIPFTLADSGVPANSQDAVLITITGDVPPCTDTCESLGYTSGTWLICGEMVNCGDVPPPGNYNIKILSVSSERKFEEGQENILIEFKAKNLGERGKYLVETGIIPKSVAEDWGYDIPETFSLFDWYDIRYKTACCPGQENIFANTIHDWDTNEEHIFKIRIPKAPYEDIPDKCFSNQYWDGTGEYVLYVTGRAMAGSETGCYPEGVQAGDPHLKLIEITNKTIGNGDCEEPFEWSELKKQLKPTDKEIEEKFCVRSSDCCSIEGKDVNCIEIETFEEEFNVKVIDSALDKFAQFFTEGIKGDLGVCVASTEEEREFNYISWVQTTFGLDKTTATIVGFGIPVLLLFIFMKMFGSMILYNGKKPWEDL